MSLIDEIKEQPTVLERQFRESWSQVSDIARALRKRDIEFVYIVARGTSDHAGLYAKYTLGIRNNLVVAMAVPSLFTLYKSPPRLNRALVIGISQSGESEDLISAMSEAKRQGASTLVITNSPQSRLAQIGEWVLDIGAGKEEAVAATKSYTAQLQSIAMLSAALQDHEEPCDVLKQVPQWVQQTLDAWDDSMGHQEEAAISSDIFRQMNRCTVLGRGYNYATAFEWALKLKELTYVAAEPYSTADFWHGPIAVVENDYPVLAILPSGCVFKEGERLINTLIHEKKASVAIVSDRCDSFPEAQMALRLPEVPEWLSPLISIIPAQRFCHALTLARGLDPNAPRGLRKITSTE